MIPNAKPLLGKEEEARVIQVLRSGELAAGTYVQEFEQAFSNYNNSRYAIATSSGTTALHTIFEALGLSAGDKIFVTSFSFIASANAILYTGATPVFVDIDPETFNMSPAELEASILKYPEAKAVLVVHIFGLPADMSKIMKLASKYNLTVLEDCAQAHGATYQGQKVGTFGKAAAFSFYPSKNMTTGEGGIVVTDDPALDSKMRTLINHGQRQRYYHEMVGFNYRMSNIHAAIGLEQLKRLETFNKKRRENALYLDQNINNPLIKKPVTPPDRTHVYHQYTIRVAERKSFTAHLEANGVGYGIYYPLILPSQKPYRDIPTINGKWPVAESLADSCVSIPVHPALTQSELFIIAETINRYGSI